MILKASAVLFVAFTCATLFSQDIASHSTAPSKSLSQLDTNQPTLRPRDERYQLERGDTFEITFALTPEFNQTVTIQPDGYISLRGAGDLAVLGRTIPEAAKIIGSAYSTILDNPRVSLNLRDFEKPYFIAGGWVEKPGKYDLRGETTLSQALQVAGGVRDGGKTSHVLLFRRVSNNWIEVKKINMKQIMAGKDINEDVQLQPGDMFLVPKSTFAKVAPFIPRADLATYFQPGSF